MRWLVEVSRVGETAASERYCIEAKRWQSALQEARRMRGDSGALPKLTIELLDEGYRAVDPQLKVRYVVTEAPAGTPLTEGAQVPLTTYPPPAVTESQAPVPAAPASSVPAPERPSPPPVTSSLPPPTLASPRPSGPPVIQVIRQREESATEANPIEYRELALAVKPGVTRDEVRALLEAKLEEVRGGMPATQKRYVQIAVFDHMFVKRPVRPPLATLAWKDWRGEPSLDFRGFDEKRASSEPPALSSRAPSWTFAEAAATAASIAPLGPLPKNLGGTSTRAPAPSTAPAPVVPVGAAPTPSEDPARRPSVIPSRVVSVGPSAPPADPQPQATRQTLLSAAPPAPVIEVGAASISPSDLPPPSTAPSEPAPEPAPADSASTSA
ncbi:MAG TPA: hypothetical protein VGK73_30175, partial [Polyangiaceae bacterium]